MKTLLRSLVALSLAALAAGSHASPLSALGLADGVGLLSFGDAEVRNNSVGGTLMIGGNAKINSTDVGTGPGGNGAVVAGNLEFSGATIKGNTTVGGKFTSGWGNLQGDVAVGGGIDASKGLSAPTGTLTVWGPITGVPQWGPTVTPGTGEFSLGFDFASAQSHARSLSSDISSYAATGSTADRWGTLVFDAAGLSLAIFDITAADASKNMRLDNLAADATVIINVHGETVDFGNHGYDGFAANQVLFNLADAKSVAANGWLVGSLLAPNAAVVANAGNVVGQVVAGSWHGSTTIGGQAFAGTLPQVSPIANVPEPASLALLLGGLVAAGSSVRRRKG